MYRVQVALSGEERILVGQRGGEIEEDLLWVEPENDIRQPAGESGAGLVEDIRHLRVRLGPGGQLREQVLEGVLLAGQSVVALGVRPAENGEGCGERLKTAHLPAAAARFLAAI